MKIIILHGDYVEKSRKRLQKFIDTARSRGWETVKIMGGDASVSDSLRTNTLFEEKRLFVIENPKKLTKEEIVWIKENESKIDETLVIYSKSVMTKSQIQSFGNVSKVELFELPKYIWKFIDSFRSGNTRECLRFFHQTIESDPAEFAFALIVRELRDMYHVIVSPESFKGAPWRVSKLKSKASKFGMEKLRSLVSQMAQIDIDTKTSKADLTSSLDFLIMRELE